MSLAQAGHLAPCRPANLGSREAEESKQIRYRPQNDSFHLEFPIESNPKPGPRNQQPKPSLGHDTLGSQRSFPPISGQVIQSDESGFVREVDFLMAFQVSLWRCLALIAMALVGCTGPVGVGCTKGPPSRTGLRFSPLCLRT